MVLLVAKRLRAKSRIFFIIMLTSLSDSSNSDSSNFVFNYIHNNKTASLSVKYGKDILPTIMKI